MPNHKRLTEDKRQRDAIWQALRPRYLRYLGRTGMHAKTLAADLGISPESLNKYLAEAASPAWQRLRMMEEYIDGRDQR